MIGAAGDVACDPSSSSFNGGNGTSSNCRQKAVSDVMLNSNLTAVLVLGDVQYEDGAEVVRDPAVVAAYFGTRAA